MPVSRLSPAILAAALLAAASLPALAGDAPGTPRAAAAAQSPDYQIHGGDQLHVIVFGETDLTRDVTVLPDGTINYPLAGEINVHGLSPDQAADAIATSLKKYLRQPHVSVVVVQQGLLDVLVLGNVVKPGKYELPPTSRLTDAIASAGGLGPTDGDLPNVRLANEHGDVTQVSLQKLLHEGDTVLNAPLADEMTVYVPSPLTLQVEVLGAVDKPGDVLVHEGDRLSMAIARAGNSKNANADLNRITLRRIEPNGTIQTSTINLYDVLKSGDINRDPVLHKSDLVYVPESGGHTNRSQGVMNILYMLGGLF
jgi:polysaccharide export outer membrane protein